MIQIITYDVSKFSDFSDKQYKISKFGEIQALDDFEMCVIDLTNEYLWNYNGISPTLVNCYKDLLTIKEAIINSNTSKILIVFPQNKKISYNQTTECNGATKKHYFQSSIQLKDNKHNLIKIISNYLLNLGTVGLIFEKTNTILIEKKINADFYLINYKPLRFEALTFSQNSNKVTTINRDKIYITTLKILDDSEILQLFIDRYCRIEQEKEEIPEWIKDIKFYNDEQLKKEKNKNNDEIQKLKDDNIKLEEQLKKNLKYKSILYTSGDELVNVVLGILDEILEYDSSNFVDEKKEDFCIKKEDITFIGEIKGVSDSVKNENVSQLDVHVQSYLDKLQQEKTEEKVKGLLIINHQRNKPLGERQKVHKHQIDLATRNESLIIETQTLLKVYEKYKLGDINREECKRLFVENIGLLKI